MCCPCFNSSLTALHCSLNAYNIENFDCSCKGHMPSTILLLSKMATIMTVFEKIFMDGFWEVLHCEQIGNAKPVQTNQGMSMFKVAFSLMSNMNQSACSTLDWVLNIQSELTKYCVSIIGYPINKKIIPMSTCPIVCCLSQKWRKWRIKQIDEDIKYCHPRWPEEKLFLENEKELLDQFKSNYFQDFWFVVLI